MQGGPDNPDHNQNYCSMREVATVNTGNLVESDRAPPAVKPPLVHQLFVDMAKGKQPLPETLPLDTEENGEVVYTRIKDWQEERGKLGGTSCDNRETGCDVEDPGEDVIPNTDAGDYIDSVPRDILQKRVSLVKLYAWIKEEMSKSSAQSIAHDLFQHKHCLLSRVDHEAICHCSWRRDAVEQLLKKILMGPNNIFDIFLQSLQEQEESHIAEKLGNTDPSPEEVHVFKLLEKSSLQRCSRPDHKDPRFSPTDSDWQTLLYYLNNKNTIDSLNDSFLSRFYFSIREHTNICLCSMDSEGRVKELLNTMKMCSDKIFAALSEHLATMEMEHVVRKLERRRQMTLKRKSARVSEDTSHDDEPSTSNAAKRLRVDTCIEHRLVTSMQKSSSLLRLHAIDQLGFDVENINKGSIVIQLCPKSVNSWKRLEDNCTSGKIKDFIPVIYNNDAIQDLLQEGIYRLQFTIYALPTPPMPGTDNQEGGKALFHLETEHEAPQQGASASNASLHDNPIEDYMDLLCEELEISKDLLKLLKEENIVEENIKEDIDKQGSRAKKIKFLLKKISNHGNKGYEVLKKYIEENNEDLYKELKTREGVNAIDVQLDTSAKVTKRSKVTVGHRGSYSKQVFFTGTVVLKVKKNAAVTTKENVDPSTDRQMEISCPEIVNPVCHFSSETGQAPKSGGEVTMVLEEAWTPVGTSKPNREILVGKRKKEKQKSDGEPKTQKRQPSRQDSEEGSSSTEVEAETDLKDGKKKETSKAEEVVEIVEDEKKKDQKKEKT